MDRGAGMRGAWATLVLAALLASVGNVPLWVAAASGHDGLSPLGLAALFLVLLATFNLLLQCATWRPLLKPVGALLLLVSGVATTFMLEYGVVIDESMIRNVAQTDGAEAGEFLTPRIGVLVTCFALLPAAWFVTRRIRREPWRRALALRGGVVLASTLCAGLVALPAYREVSILLRCETKLRRMLNPVAPLAAVVDYLDVETDVARGPPAPLAPDAWQPAPDASRRRLVVVFVLGETASAGHFALNGYGRPTNPELEARDVLNFPDVTACGTSTADAVPCLFSGSGREGYSRDEARGRENLLDVLQRVGVDVLWRDNNSGSKGVADRVPCEDVAGPPELSSGDGYFDEALLAGLRERIAQGRDDLLVVLHQKGSHGPAYSRRTPPAFKRFLPECDRVDLKNCPRDELVNAYDNTILYTDFVLGRVIDMLASLSGQADVAMLYVSDHGESLGENGIYLHGFPYWLAPREQIHVPLVFWASRGFFESREIDREALPEMARRPHSHDDVFHTLLGLFDVRTSAYDARHDLFAAARRAG